MYITYITYIKENFNLFACFETDFKPASQYCNDSVTHEWENTTQFAQYTYAKRIEITRLKDVFTELVT